MKKIIILFLLLSSCNSPYQSDHEIESLMIGVWYIPPSKNTILEYRNSRTTYTKDKKVIYVEYSDISCEKEVIRVEGSWEIKDKHLYITIGNSEIPQFLKTGTVLVDKILSISHEHHRLISTKGGKEHSRTRISTCSRL